MVDPRASQLVSCQEVVELVSDYLEGALTPGEAALVEQHLNFCDGCDRHVDQLRITIAAVGRIEQEDVPPAMQRRLLVAFRDRGARDRRQVRAAGGTGVFTRHRGRYHAERLGL